MFCHEQLQNLTYLAIWVLTDDRIDNEDGSPHTAAAVTYSGTQKIEICSIDEWDGLIYGESTILTLYSFNDHCVNLFASTSPFTRSRCSSAYARANSYDVVAKYPMIFR